MSKRNNSWSLFLCGILIHLVSSCYEPEAGCLDANATNYDLDADDPCGDCCTYPKMLINFEHKIFRNDQLENINFGDSVYTDGAGHSFSFNDIQFYISDVGIVDKQNNIIGVQETVSFVPAGETEAVTVSDNIQLVNPKSFRASTMGTFNASDEYEHILISIGVSPSLNQADTSSFDLDHPLAPQTPNMYSGVDESYIFTYIDLIIDPLGEAIPKTIRVVGNQQFLPFSFQNAFFLDKGLNLEIVFRINYLGWFSEIDLKNDSSEDIIQQLSANIPNSISLIRVN